MPIDIVLNGYFRSGTTFLWEYLRSYLEKKGYLCLYEPFHPNLAKLIWKEKEKKTLSKLHSKYLFQDYYKIPKEKLIIILRNSANNKGFEMRNDVEIKNYLDSIHELPQKIFLQPNRLHFHLDLIFKFYTKKVIHLIRHPLDVYLSIKNAFFKLYIKNVPFSKRFLRYIFKKILERKAFATENIVMWTASKLGIPINYEPCWRSKFSFKYNLLDLFVPAWVISNYFAVKIIDSYGGLLLSYERLINQTEEEVRKIQQFLNVKLDSLPKVKKGNCLKFEKKLVKEFIKIIEFWKLEEIFSDLMLILKKHEINLKGF